MKVSNTKISIASLESWLALNNLPPLMKQRGTGNYFVHFEYSGVTIAMLRLIKKGDGLFLASMEMGPALARELERHEFYEEADEPTPTPKPSKKAKEKQRTDRRPVKSHPHLKVIR